IGISAGAGLGAVVVIVVIGATDAMVSGGALLGALGAAVLIYALAYRGGVSSYRLVLSGIGVAAALLRPIADLLTRASIYDAQRATVWLTGSLNGRSWDDVRTLGLALAVLVPLALWLDRSLHALELGDATASGLGVPVERMRAALVLVAVGLVA